MSKATELVENALKQAQIDRPEAVGGFAYLAETLHQAGVTNNIWFLPACQSLYLTKEGAVAHNTMPALTEGTVDVPPFSRELVIAAVRADSTGKSTFPEFLRAAWNAGVVRYEVNFRARRVTYYGSNGDEYEESYSKVLLKKTDD